MKLLDGITYSHEHVTIDLSEFKKNNDCKLDCIEDSIFEFKSLKNAGVSNIIDVSNIGIGRDVEYISTVEKATGMNIIVSTGYYKEPFLPEEVYTASINTLAKKMTDEILYGISDTSYKASIIGEIGTSLNAMSDIEKKVFESSALAHNETGVPIITHTTLGTHGKEQVDFLKERQVCLDKVIISHVDLSGDIDYILNLIDMGVYVAFDTIGKVNYQNDELRAQMLKQICDRNLSDRVLLSMDITRKSSFKKNGGVGYCYLVDTFIPMLQIEGISQASIDNMTKLNIQKII